MMEYPAFQFDFLNPEQYNFKRVLSRQEVGIMQKQFEKVVGRSVFLVPGACIGKPSGNCGSSKLDDFAWGRIWCPQVSREAKEVFAKDGIEFVTAEMLLEFRGSPITSHLAMQPEVTTMMTAESLKDHEISHCVACGDFNVPPRKIGYMPRYAVDGSRWPRGQHLVTMLETLDVVVSPEFMDTVRRHNLAGIEFEECGEIVP